ncbi:MAG TPA: T9SS type A sorting domain-containing protein, partial [Chitinophagaceae bacterium]|nr:T9SS type A sorting domain-containing protein [Chitinophagaceae bacterium]
VMTGDNHTTNGTTGRFYQYLTLGPNTAQDVADWNAVRATSYIYPDMPITSEQAVFFQEQGFEISLHTNTGCSDYTQSSLRKDFNEDLKRFAISYPGVAAPVTNRSHCLNWSDWSSTPKTELQNGIRLDATYYYWPEEWMKNRPGMFTGSGIPMRFADMDGSLIDVYQVPTQMTDETNMNYSAFCNELLDKAIGPEGYYGVFCANMHTDHKSSAGSDAIIASAQARGVPVISAKQLLNWLDGRNNSFFNDIAWHNNQLSFSVTVQRGAHNLKAMLPLYSETGRLNAIVSDGNPVSFTIQMIKGIEYAFFAPFTGMSTYIAKYSGKKDEKKVQIALEKTIKESVKDKLYLNATPNPGIGYFNLVINSYDAEPVTVRILDNSGSLVETHKKIASTGILRLGEKWKTGTYYAEVLQGEQKEVTKLLKLN